MLEPSLKKVAISKMLLHRGKSDRGYEFGLAIQERDRLTPVETVTPRGHSVNSKYIALSGMSSERNICKISAHDDELPEVDILLLRNFAAFASPNSASRIVAG